LAELFEKSMNKSFSADLSERPRVELVIDTICPWCYIGKQRIEQALADEGVTNALIEWRPFLLNPDMPRAGIDRQYYLSSKFGGRESAKRVYDVIALSGAATGIDFNFDDIKVTPNSVDSHRLIRYCARNLPEQTDVLVENVFKSYFLYGEDIGDSGVLVRLGEEVGLDGETLRSYLAGSTDSEAVENENLSVHRLGVSGVPCYIFNKRYALAGAQEPEILKRMIRLAMMDSVSV
jgi:predicted DsbA family dithiol-disulfide isomerase